MNTIDINLGELELDVEVEYEWYTSRFHWCDEGGSIQVHRIWLGDGDKRVDILPALDSLDLGVEDSVMEKLDLEDLEPDADHAMELARVREAEHATALTRLNEEAEHAEMGL